MNCLILLIDDEPDFTELIKSLLSFHELVADVCNEPSRAEPMLKAKHYQIIVTDLMMPGLDGFEIIRRVRGEESYREVPIVALSAKTLSEAERKFLLEHQVHLVTKPFDPQELVERIRALGTFT